MMSATSQWRLYLFGDNRNEHRRWFKGGRVGEGRIDIEEKNLSRANPGGIFYQGIRLRRCDLADSNLSTGNLRDSEIFQCNWNNALLNGINFDRSMIKECDFVDAYLGTADFTEAKIKGGDWTRSDLDKSTWTGAVVENVCFQRVNLWRSQLQGSYFKECDFRNGNLMSVKADNAVFENCDFRGVYLRSFRFNNTKFINCGFYGCIGNPKLEGECILIQPDLSEAFDGTGIVEPEQLLKQWQLFDGQSQTETTISLSNSPQWLDYISRERRADQVDWVSAGMNGSPPMNLEGKDLSKAFAYRAYFKAARFTDCDFTASDLRRSQVQKAKFIGCTFNNALLMYLEATRSQYLDVKTSEVLFKDCTAKGAYVNRSELWQPKFIGGNWSGSFFNNCVWTCVEAKNVSFENTDWRGAEINTVKFINCNFRGALFDEAIIKAAQFINCDFRGADFGFAQARRATMDKCAFYGTKGRLGDIVPLDEDEETRVIDADLSPNFDGSLVFESLERTQDLFSKIRSNFPEIEARIAQQESLIKAQEKPIEEN